MNFVLGTINPAFTSFVKFPLESFGSYGDVHNKSGKSSREILCHGVYF